MATRINVITASCTLRLQAPFRLKLQHAEPLRAVPSRLASVACTSRKKQRQAETEFRIRSENPVHTQNVRINVCAGTELASPKLTTCEGKTHNSSAPHPRLAGDLGSPVAGCLLITTAFLEQENPTQTQPLRAAVMARFRAYTPLSLS